jgi:hypothetical protein
MKVGVLKKLSPVAVVAVVSLGCSGCATTEYYAPIPKSAPSLYSNERPPERFQGNATIVLTTADQTGVDQACLAQFGPAPEGMKTDACETGGRIFAPNPCSFPETDLYARILCHEIGHANGWPATHGD